MLYLLIFIVFWLVLALIKKRFFENKYIENHKRLQKEISDYEKYLKFCEKTNSIPLHKKDFINELHRNEKSFNEILKS